MFRFAEIPLKIALTRPDVVLPEYATDGSSGFDLCLWLEPELRNHGILSWHSSIRIYNTGIAVEVPPGFELQIRSRSGLSSKGLFVANSPGTIDSDYRGEIKIILHHVSVNNFSTDHIRLHHGDRIAQAVLAPVVHAKFNYIPCSVLSESERSDGGLGHTGISKEEIKRRIKEELNNTNEKT